MIKAVIFDCFGVIITDVLQAIRQEVERTNPEGAQEIQDIIRMTNKGMLDFGNGTERISTIIGISTTDYRQRLRDGEYKDVELLSYIRNLKKQYKTALLSNITVSGLQRRFSEAELAEHFDEVVVSESIGYAKPEPEAYEYTARQLGVRLDECIFMDDRELFCEAARDCGMQAIEYRSFLQCKTDLDKILGTEF